MKLKCICSDLLLCTGAVAPLGGLHPPLWEPLRWKCKLKDTGVKHVAVVSSVVQRFIQNKSQIVKTTAWICSVFAAGKNVSAARHCNKCFFNFFFFLVFVFLCVLCISASSHTHGTDCVVRCCLTCPCFIYLQLHFYKLRACVAKDLLFLIRTHLLVFCLDRIFFCYSLWWRLIVKPAS